MRNKKLIQDILEKLAEKENSNSKIEKNIENLMKNTNEEELILYLRKLELIKLLQIKSNLENYEKNKELKFKLLIPYMILLFTIFSSIITLILGLSYLNSDIKKLIFGICVYLFIIRFSYKLFLCDFYNEKITCFENNYKIVLYLVNFAIEIKKEELRQEQIKIDIIKEKYNLPADVDLEALKFDLNNI
mgnify:CR=1 FL=1